MYNKKNERKYSILYLLMKEGYMAYDIPYLIIIWYEINQDHFKYGMRSISIMPCKMEIQE